MIFVNINYEHLNEKQREAVFTTEGPVAVIAGAGSGKTRVLTYRIARLIEMGIDPESILAVTFTNKAAEEMKHRVLNLVGPYASAVTVSTFHSFCAGILRKHIHHLGYSLRFTIIDEDDALQIIRDVLKSIDLDAKVFPPKMLKALISKRKNGIAIAHATQDFQEFDRIFDKYQAILENENLVDFDDLLVLVIRLFETEKTVLDHYQQFFQYIMIDEFQDTNDIQYRLVNYLAKTHNNVFVVGDQDQSIYAFRGANYHNLSKFFTAFKKAKQILLEENYRSTKPILTAANNLIANNQNRVIKNLFTSLESNEPVYVYSAQTDYEEAHFIVERIKQLLDYGMSPDDIALIYRANSLSRLFEEILMKARIPYVIYGGLSFFSRREIKDMLAYFRLMINPNDNYAFKRIINVPKRKIGGVTIEKIEAHALKTRSSIFEAIDTCELPKATKQTLVDFKKMIQELKDLILETPFVKLVDLVSYRTGYDEMLKNEGDEGLDRLDNIQELKSVFSGAEDYYEGDHVDKLILMLDDMALKTDQDMDKTVEDRVKLMNYHQAKGLEFKVVFLAAMEEGIFPGMNAVFEPTELEEERRVAYVGVTRAKEKLFLSYANRRLRYGQFQHNMPSRFIKEMRLREKIERPIITEDAEVVLYKAGEKVNHKDFGDGLVVGIDGDKITVAFALPFGIKKLLAAHPSIRKI